MDRKEVKLFLTFFLIYAFFVQWYGWNEQSRFILTKAIVEENRFEIDSLYNTTGDRAYYRDHYYSDKDPGVSFMAAPIYGAWRFIYYNFFPQGFIQKYSGDNGYMAELQGNTPIFTYINPGFFTFTSMILVSIFTSSLFTALTVLLVYRVSRYFTKNKTHRALATLAYGLGTAAFPGALHFMDHAAGAFFAFLAFFLLFRAKNEKPHNRLFAMAGLAAGLASMTGPLIAVIAVFCLGYAFTIDRRKSLVFLFALLIGMAPLLFYNYTIFSSPFDYAGAHIDREIYRTAFPEREPPLVARLEMERPEMELPEKTTITKSSFFSFEPIKKLLEHFHFAPTLQSPYVVLRMLVYPYRGLLFYSPVLFLSLIGLVYMAKNYRAEAVLVILVLASFLLILSMRTSWWGGHSFQNRHLLPVVPFLMIPILYLFGRVNQKFVLFLIFPLIVLSVFINFLGLQPAEDYAYDWDLMAMRSDWLAKQGSFQVMYNPLLSHYWPLFLEHGPRSGIFENLVNGHISIDIRFPALSKGTGFPFSAFHIPFLSLVPVCLAVCLIWLKEIRQFLGSYTIFRFLRQLKGKKQE